MKPNFQISLLIFLLTVSLVPPFSAVEAQQSNDKQFITGFRSPMIDGFIQPNSNSQNLDEWEDAFTRQIDLKESNGKSKSVQISEKMVKNSLFIALSVPDFGNDLINHISLQIDRDQNNGLSAGDVRVYLTRVDISDQKLDPMPSEIILTITSEYYNGDEWKIPSGSKEILAYNWADIAISDVIKTKSTEIELGIDLAKIEHDLPEYPSKFQAYPNKDASEPAQLMYGITIDTVTDVHYGFPEAPEIDPKSLRPSLVVGSFVAYYDIPPVLPNREVGVGNIILTQATQTENNDYRVIQGKEALVRVIIDNNAGVLQWVRVRMKVYHYHFVVLTLVDTQELDFIAPLTPHIQRLSDTVNFYLSPTVTDTPGLVIEVEVEVIGEFQDPNPDNDKVIHYQFMTESYPVNVYYSQMNVQGMFLARSTIDQRINYTKMVFPVADLNFIEVNWRDMGGNIDRAEADRYDEVMNRYRDILIAQIRASIRHGWTVPAYPDQVHGFTPGGSGRADAFWAWGGGRNRVSWSGGNSGHFEMTTAHEMTHNMDGGWGKHATGHGYGCGAPDGTFSKDDDWNNAYGDNYIHDLGWNPINGLIAGNKGELMTYCVGSFEPGVAAAPTQWVGGYRWERWVDRLANYRLQRDVGVSPTLSLNQNSATSVRVLEITGNVNGVSISPSFEIQGEFISSDYKKPEDGTADIQLELFYNNNTSMLMEFDVDRIPLENYTNEEEDLSSFYLSQMVPDNGELTGYELYDLVNQKVISSHNAGSHNFDVTAQYDSNWDRGKETTVFLAVSGNTSRIHFQLMYAPDGQAWFPLGTSTTDDIITTVINDLPGGENSKLIVLASDGVKTVKFEGATFSLDHQAPTLKLRHNNHLISTLTLNDPNSEDPQLISVGTYNTSVGSAVPLSIAIQNEWGNLAKNPMVTWRVFDQSNSLIDTINDRVDFSSFKFREPGLYSITVDVTDPLTGLTSSESLKIRVNPFLIRALDSEYQSFKVGLEKIRQESGISSSSKGSGGVLPINPVMVYSAMLILAVIRIIKNRNSSY